MPIRQLTEQMLQFKASGFDMKSIKTSFLPNKQDNEVFKLAYVFKEMAEQIDEQAKEKFPVSWGALRT